jgi:hypothetical protein
MSFAKRPGNKSTDLFMPQGKRSQDAKSSFDVTDDLEHATSLSYTSHIPLNRDPNPAQSTTSIPPQHADIPSQTQADREGDPPQVYFESHSQGHNPRSSSWDLLGGARKLGQAYEQFDPRNASEQHLVFADGDLPNSKVGHHFLMHMALTHKPYPYQFVRFYQFLLNASIVTRWTLFIIPVLAIIWIPGILGLTVSRKGEVRSLLSYGLHGQVDKRICICTDLGSAFDMVEYMAKRCMGRYDRLLFHTIPISCGANSVGWWASLAGAYVFFRTPISMGQLLTALFNH